MRFSQRIGKRPVKDILQLESIDVDLKNRLWNAILEDFFDRLDNSGGSYNETEAGNICKHIWKDFFKHSVDKISKYQNVNVVYVEGFLNFVRSWFYKAEWFEIYDFIEFLSDVDLQIQSIDFTTACNFALTREVSAYRIINGRVVQITSEDEVQAIEEALEISNKWAPVNLHLRTSLEMLSDRKSPDYRNSIKESISAVEALCIMITGDSSASLGRALSEIEKKHALHSALKSSFSSLYGYTSDASGIRHALVETGASVEFEDAKFMLVSCSAFINYLKSKMKMYY